MAITCTYISLLMIVRSTSRIDTWHASSSDGAFIRANSSKRKLSMDGEHRVPIACRKCRHTLMDVVSSTQFTRFSTSWWMSFWDRSAPSAFRHISTSASRSHAVSAFAWSSRSTIAHSTSRISGVAAFLWFFSTAALCSRSSRSAAHVASALSMWWFSTASRKSKMPAPPRRSLIIAFSSRLANIWQASTGKACSSAKSGSIANTVSTHLEAIICARTAGHVASASSTSSTSRHTSLSSL